MAIEQLISTQKLKDRPAYTFFIGFFCTIIAIILSLRIFPEYASIVMVTFTVLPLVGVMYLLISQEERQYELHVHILWTNPVLKVFCFLFLGMMVAYTAGFVILPQATSAHVYAQQLAVLSFLDGPTSRVTGAGIPVEQGPYGSACDPQFLVNGGYSGCRSADLNNDGQFDAVYYRSAKPVLIGMPDGSFVNYHWFVFRSIFVNNLQVLLMVFLLSLIFGAGSLFVLAWNASILGVFFGSWIGELVNRSVGVLVYQGLPISVWMIWLHGIPEFIAFFMSAISGGVLGIVLIKRKYQNPVFKNVIFQSAAVFVFSLMLLATAAAIEAYAV